MAPSQKSQAPTIELDPVTGPILMRRAGECGMPREQIEGLLMRGYLPLPWSLGFHAAAREADRGNGPVMIGCGGARGPGKSHAIMAQVGLDDCQRAPGLKVLFLRRVLKSAAESFDDLIRKVFHSVPRTQLVGRVEFPAWNDSRILIGGYNDERDIDKFLGIEYDAIVIEESTQISGERREMIRGSLRTSRSDWRPRLYESTNPGGVGHTAFKKLYIDPWRRQTQGDTRFFPATYRDNPFLKPEYIKYLEGLTGTLGKMWRDGDWDVFQGQAFPSFSWDRHVCKPFDIPAHWTRYRGVDWGYRNPFACVWLAKEPDTGRLYIYRELYQTGLTDRQQARAIHDNSLSAERFAATFADPSMWATKNVEDRIYSTYDEYAAEKIFLTKADNGRLLGKRKVDTLLADLPDGRPGLMIFESCANWLETVTSLPYATAGNPEDVDTSADDHLYDATRYALTQINPRPRPAPMAAQQAAGDPIARLIAPTTGLSGRDF